MNRTKMLVGEGQMARWTHWGVYAFAGTDTTVDVIVPLGSVEDVQLTPIGAPAATEAPLSVNETIVGTTGAAGCSIAGNTGTNTGTTTLTIARPAGTTSGLKFFLRAWSGGRG